jgi:hypothetical protein
MARKKNLRAVLGDEGAKIDAIIDENLESSIKNFVEWCFSDDADSIWRRHIEPAVSGKTDAKPDDIENELARGWENRRKDESDGLSYRLRKELRKMDADWAMPDFDAELPLVSFDDVFELLLPKVKKRSFAGLLFSRLFNLLSDRLPAKLKRRRLEKIQRRCEKTLKARIEDVFAKKTVKENIRARIRGSV